MKNNTRKVWVNPVQRISSQGRDKQYYQIIDKNGMLINTHKMQKTKEFDVGTTYSFPYDSNTQRIHTGLQELTTNPFYEMDKEEVIRTYQVHADYLPLLDKFLSSERVTKQQLLEIKHGKKPGDYNSNMGYNMFNLPADMKQFDFGKGELAKIRMTLYPRPNVLKSDSPRQELLIAMVEALVDVGMIAKSKDEANPSIHEFYISEDNQEEAELSRKRDLIESAMFKLYKLKNESPYIKQLMFATVLRASNGQTLVRGDVTPERVKGVLSQYISDKNRNQMTHVDRLVKLYDLQDTPEGADRLHVMYLVQAALNTGVIMHRDDQYFWLSKSDSPDLYKRGSSFDKMVNFFLKEMNTPQPKGKKVVDNYYKDLLNEVKSRNIPFE